MLSALHFAPHYILYDDNIITFWILAFPEILTAQSSCRPRDSHAGQNGNPPSTYRAMSLRKIMLSHAAEAIDGWMVERVVAALDEQLKDFPEIGAARLPGIARAVIEAMREPTEEMKDAGADAGPFADATGYAVRPKAEWDAARVWEATIDAALKP